MHNILTYAEQLLHEVMISNHDDHADCECYYSVQLIVTIKGNAKFPTGRNEDAMFLLQVHGVLTSIYGSIRVQTQVETFPLWEERGCH